MAASDVLIVGAGPTGLVLGLWLTRLGLNVRILDKTRGPGSTSRALLVQARTLELYGQLDLAEAVLAKGHRVEALNVWVEGEPKARVETGALGQGLTPYPYLQILPQDEHETLLVHRLAELGVTIERCTELLNYTDHRSHVSARLRNSQGNEEICEALFIAGCDGASSTVRKAIGAGFPGGTYRQLFYVADVRGRGRAMNGEVHVDLDEADFLMVIAMGRQERARLIGLVGGNRADIAKALTFADVSQTVIDKMRIKIDTVNWFSTYRVHHRVAEYLRRGRAFLVGDSGHIHSPAGGQGMNTGIGDAINLAWKLAAVVKGGADEGLLDSYQSERLPFARRLVQTTDRMFNLVTSEGRFAEFVRTQVTPLLLPVVTRVPAAPEFMFRLVSQTMISYRDGPLGAGQTGAVHGGDRLPWAPASGSDNFDSLNEMRWQVHVYGQARDDLIQWCASKPIPLHTFTWAAEHKDAGLARNATYLIRPDSYVAMVDSTGGVDAIAHYFAKRGIVPA